MYDENDEPQYPAHMDQELSERIFNDVGNIDHIYTVIQECVDEVTEEQFMQIQQGVSLMRIFLATVVVLLGANFAIELMNSNMVDLMEERKEQMERAIDRM